MVNISEVNYKDFGRCLRIANDVCEVHVTIDFGPRVIGYNVIGKENIMREDATGFSISGEVMDEFYGKGTTWYIRGGHRIWTSPESMPGSYWPDNAPVPYEKVENGAMFICEPLEKNGIAYKMQVTLDEKTSDVKVDMFVKNISDKPSTFAIWALTVLSQGGMEIVPQNTKDTGLLGNRKVTLWPYTKLTDPRVFWGDEYITLIQDRFADYNFKVGLDNENGWAAYLNKGQLYVKHYTHLEDAVYPDNNVSFETFTCKNFLEMESLGTLGEVKPGQEVSHSETWSIIPCDETFNPKNEESIKAFVDKFVK
ncbi:MAG: hypothetical protein IKV58_01440 [Oscillospiraceae bacterium]|nr:hypothetical protein [Oscillospiraceae bacterium]